MPKLPIDQITIVPRERTLGFVAFNTEQSRSKLSKKDIESHICIALAGRIAQMKKFGEDSLDTGAVSDLESATLSAYKMISLYGMDENLGYVSMASINHSDIYKNEIDKKVVTLMHGLKIKTEELIDENWESIIAVAKILLKREVIHEDELLALIEQSKKFK